MSEKPHWITLTYEFAGKFISGFLIFFLIAIPAILISLFIKHLESYGVSASLITILQVVDYAIVVVDALAFVYHLVYSLYEFIKESHHA